MSLIYLAVTTGNTTSCHVPAPVDTSQFSYCSSQYDKSLLVSTSQSNPESRPRQNICAPPTLVPAPKSKIIQCTSSALCLHSVVVLPSLVYDAGYNISCPQ